MKKQAYHIFVRAMDPASPFVSLQPVIRAQYPFQP